MRILSNHQILAAWESGRAVERTRRGLLLAQLASPTQRPEELARMSVGRRDRMLLDLRRLTFGPTQEGVTICPACGDHVEFSFSLDTILSAANGNEADSSGSELWVRCDEFECQFRLIRADDLDAAARAESVEAARQCLIRRCVNRVIRGGVEEFSAGPGTSELALPEEVVARIAEAMDQADPLADLRFDTQCPACGHRWSDRFDVLTCLWQEIESRGRRLLEQVHVLAGAYGWSEMQILELSASRREHYVNLVGGG
jgi:hypothetical protein